MSNLAYILAAAAILVVVVVAAAVLLGAGAVRERASADGRRVLRVRARPFRNLFTRGLTPLAVVYRVTAEKEGRSTVRLYAYDPGQFFSRHHQPVRLFSGGVWRDA